MKAEYKGIVLEGSPEEVAKVIELIGLAKEVETIIKYVPSQPYQPWWTEPMSPYVKTLTDSATVTWSGPTTCWNGTLTI